MLKDLEIRSFKLNPLVKMLSGINKSKNSKEDFEHYETGVYRYDRFGFNFDHFIRGNCNNVIVDEWVDYGVCDDYHQILEKRANILNEPDKYYVINLSTVKREDQYPKCGWRWHKWGEYIGNHEIKHEYLNDEEDIDKVYCYSIYEIQ